jgi:DNA-binding response OmpR family regulator
VINDEIAIPCTQKEYQIFMMTLDLKPITDLALIHELFGCAPDGSIRNTVRRHVERLREKIKPTELDIRRIQGYGYLLVELEEWNML